MSDSSPDSDFDPEDKPNWKRLFTGHLPLEQETLAFIFVCALDIFMTYVILRHGRTSSGGYFIESNPVADFFLSHWGTRGLVYFKMGMTAFVCVISQIVAVKKPKHGEFILKVGILIVGCVVIYSLVLYIRMR